MKSQIKILLLLITISLSYSCDEAEELINEISEIEFTEDVTRSFTVDLPDESDDPVEWAETTTIDIASNPEIEDNLDLISGVEINSLTFEIDNYSGVDNAIVTEAYFMFNGNSISISDINLEMSDANGTIYTISDISILEEIATALENNPEITVTFGGTVSATPVMFDILITLNVTATAELG
jgi:hypothetical protein